MTRSEIIQEIKANNYFCIQELVCTHAYMKFGERAWQFLDTELLHTLLVIRKNIGKAIYINNWDSGGILSQRVRNTPEGILAIEAATNKGWTVI